MRCATCFLPSWRTLLTSWETSCDPNTGSMSMGRFGAGPLRGISALLLLGAVAAASLLAVLHALGVERAADDLVADAGEVLHTTAAHEHDRVLLQVVADAGDVGRDLDAARQAHTGDLAEGGVRLLGGGRVHTRAHTTALGRALERRGLGLGGLVLAALADQLVDGRQPGDSVTLLVVSRPGGRLLGCSALRPPRSGVSRGCPCRFSPLHSPTGPTWS